MGDVPDGQGLIANLILAAEWAARESTDKDLKGSTTNQGRLGSVTVAYAVPAAKTLYISEVYFTMVASAAADSDLNQIGYVTIFGTLLIPVSSVGGNGGGGMVFPKPFVVTGGKTCTLQAVNRSNHNCDIWVNAHGYEV